MFPYSMYLLAIIDRICRPKGGENNKKYLKVYDVRKSKNGTALKPKMEIKKRDSLP